MFVYRGKAVELRGPFKSDVLSLCHAVIDAGGFQTDAHNRLWVAKDYAGLQNLISEYRIPVVWR